MRTHLRALVAACAACLIVANAFAAIQVCDTNRTPEGVTNFKMLGSDYQGGGYANIKFSFDYKSYTSSGGLPGCVQSYKVETKAKSDGKLLHTDTFQSGSPIAGASGTIINLPANTEVFMVVTSIGPKGSGAVTSSPSVKTNPGPTGCNSGIAPAAPYNVAQTSSTYQGGGYATGYVSFSYDGIKGLGCIKEWTIEVYNYNDNKLIKTQTFPATDKNTGLTNAKVINLPSYTKVVYRVYGKGLNGAVGPKGQSNWHNTA